MNPSHLKRGTSNRRPRARARISGMTRLLACGGLAFVLNSAPAQTYTLTTLAGQAGQRGSTNGAGSAARFAAPAGVALDSLGNLYVADTGNHTIRKITPAGVVSTLAGLAGQSGSADGVGSTARFNGPTGVAVDALGNVYVADQGNALVRQILPAGLVMTLPLASLSAPSAIALDSAGNGYVADRILQIVGKTSPDGVQNVLAGSPGRVGTVDGTGGAARFNGPSGVAVNSAGTVFVIDGGNFTVRKITAGGLATTLAGSPLLSGYTDGIGSTAKFNFRATVGIAADGAGGVLLADDGNHLIRRITAAGWVTTVAGLPGNRGSADGTAGTAQLDAPAGLAMDRAGNIYVADTGNQTIRLGRVSPTNPYPVMAAAPRSLSANRADTVAWTASAAGDPPLTYQWRRNGSPVAGATDSHLILNNVAAADAGTYSVVATNGSGMFTSSDATLTIVSGQTSRVSNLSVRTNLAARQTLTVGFATSGAKSMLVRAIGPSLAAFGLAGFNPDPAIALFNSAGTNVDGNDNWNATLSPVFERVGAFPLTAGSKDAALQRTITDATTAQISGPSAGVVLVEAYDAAGDSATRLVNFSTLNLVGTGDNILIAGFFVEGTAARTLLIRGVGPALAGFGVTGPLADPKLELFDSAGVKIAEADNWVSGLSALFTRVGAFALAAGSKDAALVITLPPGAGYTAQLSGVNAGTGEALLEFYEVPPSTN